jgi:hypothetical protein
VGTLITIKFTAQMKFRMCVLHSQRIFLPISRICAVFVICWELMTTATRKCEFCIVLFCTYFARIDYFLFVFVLFEFSLYLFYLVCHKQPNHTRLKQRRIITQSSHQLMEEVCLIAVTFNSSSLHRRKCK